MLCLSQRGSQIATLENCFQHQAKMALLWWQFVISTTDSVHQYIGFTWIEYMFFIILRGAIYYLSCFFLFYKYIEAWNWFWESLKCSKLIPALLNPTFPLLFNLEAYCCSQYFANSMCRNSYFRCGKAMQVVRACRYLSQSKQYPAYAMLESAGVSNSNSWKLLLTAKMALLLWHLIISTANSVHKYIGFTRIQVV